MNDSFEQYLRTRRAEIDAALAVALPSPPDCPVVLADAMRYSVNAGGKRLRPILCLSAAEAVGAERSVAMPAACAIELIHTYSLIHDDLPAMDNDTMRRGMPTLHVVAGEGIAILAGDGLLTEAFAILARLPADSPTLALRALRVTAMIAVAAGPTGMVGGQAIDLASSGENAPSLDDTALRVMHAKKTGALIRASAVAGAIMGGASDRVVASVDTAGAEFGLAFQIVDDILDVEGNTAQLGKTAGKDAAARKPTYPARFGVTAARTMADECLARAERALAEAGLADSALMQIGRWIVSRSN
jgi:geranylgeranyl diphosphate synthase type II